jgi:G:T-mismatch repair DNA endonuclease (very short patch repair protein)
VRRLRSLGFRIMTIWECQIKPPQKRVRVAQKLSDFFTA